MKSLEKYYVLLDLKPGANAYEIKKSFREKAKRYHPDVCADAHAHERFIKLTEAYEILLNYAEKKGTFKETFNRAAYYKAYNEQLARKKAEAKRKAEYAAKMKYDQFINSDYYKTNLFIDVLVDHFLFLLAVFIFVVLPVLMITYIGPGGIAGSIVVALIFAPYTLRPLLNFRKLNVKVLWLGLKYLAVKKKVSGFVLFWITVILFFNVAFRTVIPGTVFLFLFVILPVIAFVLFKVTKKGELRSSPLFYAFIFVPFGINTLLNLNYYLSFNAEKEEYAFTLEPFTVRGKRGTDTVTETLQLEGNKYESYLPMRLFYGNKDMRGNKVTLHIERGIFGLRVVKKFDFGYTEQ